ncbi:hypothetical protein OS493_005163 [Desmophyllum pertusum]|uniref:Secreted protein n=1 Tax=Desmophyllum pertusum TaxID=174260 RepID=A0A9W9Z4G2_9CNID|nr:hypothetical protein OS493_005163 [Desmophyllum pertusum]
MAVAKLDLSAVFCILLVSSCFVHTEAFTSNNRVGKRTVKLQRTLHACQHCGDFNSKKRSRDAGTDNEAKPNK